MTVYKRNLIFHNQVYVHSLFVFDIVGQAKFRISIYFILYFIKKNILILNLRRSGWIARLQHSL